MIHKTSTNWRCNATCLHLIKFTSTLKLIDTSDIVYRENARTCVDGVAVIVSQRLSELEENKNKILIPANCIYYRPYRDQKTSSFMCVITEICFNR